MPGTGIDVDRHDVYPLAGTGLSVGTEASDVIGKMGTGAVEAVQGMSSSSSFHSSSLNGLAYCAPFLGPRPSFSNTLQTT